MLATDTENTIVKKGKEIDMSIYVTIYTKEKGKKQYIQVDWNKFNLVGLIFHREDGPAIEYPSGTKEWYINGEHHREDGPAVEYPSGDKYWHINGKLHREDGPAVEWFNGTKKWYINGKEYSKTNYNKLLKEVNLLEPILGLTDPRDWVRKRFERKGIGR